MTDHLIAVLSAALIAAGGAPVLAQTTVSTVVADIEASGGLSIGTDGHLYLADFGSALNVAGGSNVYRVDADGGAIEILNGEFGGASGNAFGGDGNLYQSDVGRGEAFRIAMDGSRTRIAQDMTTPVGIAPNADGTAFVTNCTVNRIVHIGSDVGAHVLAEGAPLNCPNGLAFGGDGKLYTVNFSDGAMVRIDPESGAMEVVTRLPGGGNGHLAWANDRFYVASFRGHRIYSVSPDDGAICHIAGSGESGNEDGTGLTASFFRPNGAAVSADGDSFFTNTITTIFQRTDPGLHPNALRRVDGLLSLLDCPAERIVERGEPPEPAESEG